MLSYCTYNMNDWESARAQLHDKVVSILLAAW